MTSRRIHLFRAATFLALPLAVLALQRPALAADLDAGKNLAQTCTACHGTDLKSPIDPTYPRIAGQFDDYIVKALGDYQAGARKNPIMGGIAKPLSKSDIENVAAYIASLSGPLNQRR